MLSGQTSACSKAASCCNITGSENHTKVGHLDVFLKAMKAKRHPQQLNMEDWK